MIELVINVAGGEQVVQRLTILTDSILQRLRKTLPVLGMQLRDEASARAPGGGRHSKMSRKYGPLRDAITAKLFDDGSDKIREVVGVGKAFYGRFQETGLDVTRNPPRRRGIVGVRTRMTKAGTAIVSSRRGWMKPQGNAKPFHLPARPFMHPALESMRERIVAGIRAAIDEGIKG